MLLKVKQGKAEEMNKVSRWTRERKKRIQQPYKLLLARMAQVNITPVTRLHAISQRIYKMKFGKRYIHIKL